MIGPTNAKAWARKPPSPDYIESRTFCRTEAQVDWSLALTPSRDVCPPSRALIALTERAGSLGWPYISLQIKDICIKE